MQSTLEPDSTHRGRLADRHTTGAVFVDLFVANDTVSHIIYYALVLLVARSGDGGGSISRETRHASVVSLLKPPSPSMLQCPLLAHPCTLDNLLKFNENARKCVGKWKNAV